MKPLTVVIIGAGPAGLSAALWCKHLGLSPLIIEKASVAGGMQNLNFMDNGWVLGLPNMTGVDLGQQLYAHIQQEQIPVQFTTEVSTITTLDDGFQVLLSNNESMTCRAIVLATGTRYVGKELLQHVPGFSFIDTSLIIEGPYAFANLDNVRQQHVAIIGAGDNAFENALMLLRQGCQVYMISRSTPRAQKKFSDPVMSYDNFTLYQYEHLEQFLPCHGGLQIRLQSSQELMVDRLHILAGYQPNIEKVDQLFQQSLQQGDDGFLQADVAARTNIQGVYAAGDIANTEFPCVVSAIASGALAAKTISRDFLLLDESCVNQ